MKIIVNNFYQTWNRQLLTAGWKTLMAWTAALPFCLSPNTRSIHWHSVWETWSDSSACRWIRINRRGSLRAQGGKFTWLTLSPFWRTPKSNPVKAEKVTYMLLQRIQIKGIMENNYPLCWPGTLGGRKTLGWAPSRQSWTRRTTGATWCSWSERSGPGYQSSGLIKAKDNLITDSTHWLKRSPFMTLDTTLAEYI